MVHIVFGTYHEYPERKESNAAAFCVQEYKVDEEADNIERS